MLYKTRLFVLKELDILGSRNGPPADFLEVIAILKSGSFPVDAAISVVVPMEEAAEWLRRWDEDPSSIRKILVQVHSELS